MRKCQRVGGVLLLCLMALAWGTQPASAEPSECADFVSTGRWDKPWVGTLLGYRTVTVRGGWGSIFIEEMFNVATRGHGGEEMTLRCDTYEPYMLA